MGNLLNEECNCSRSIVMGVPWGNTDGQMEMSRSKGECHFAQVCKTLLMIDELPVLLQEAAIPEEQDGL